jgi:hypothetical protein
MWTFTLLGNCVLVLVLLTLFVLVIIARQQRTGRDVPIWLLSGFIGVLLGLGIATATVQYLGYELIPLAETIENPMFEGPGPPELIAAMRGSGGGSGGSAAKPEASKGSPGSGGPSGPGGGFGPTGKRQLTTLVRKIDLLTGDTGLNLSAEQAQAILAQLADLQSPPTMTDDEATAKHDALMAVLNADQQAKLEAVALPRPRGVGPGGPGGPPGPGAQGDANPFTEKENADALANLQKRLGAPPAKP